MKALRTLLSIFLVIIAFYGFGRFFVSQLRSDSGRSQELSGVVFSAPPGFQVENKGDLDRTEAALDVLQRARARRATPTPELLADLVRALLRMGRANEARATFTDLEAMGRTPGGLADRVDRARARARADLGG